MITHSKKGKRHTIGLNEEEFQTFAEVIWLVKKGVTPMGFNRKPLTTRQQTVIDEMFSRFNYSDDFGIWLNKMTGQ